MYHSCIMCMCVNNNKKIIVIIIVMYVNINTGVPRKFFTSYLAISKSVNSKNKVKEILKKFIFVMISLPIKKRCIDVVVLVSVFLYKL